jgi:glycosyltransferase involved in cell wall biosynthesis
MGFIKKFIYLNVLSRFIRGAGGLHYLTSHERNRGRLLIPGYHGRVLVAPNIVEIPDFRPPPFKRSELGLPEDGFLFLFLGRLHVEHKGLDILMEAFARVARELNARLALVGPDWQGGNEVLRTLARNLGCLDRVHFLEPQYHEAKWRTLAAADAFVSPSRWDAFNIALVEAIGLGRPTITTTSISLAGDLAENEAALLCAANPAALADCMKAIILDPDLRCRMAARGQEWVANQCAPLPVGRLLANFYGEVVGLS